MQPRRQFETGVDVGSNVTARTSADAGRPGRLRGRCLAARGLAAGLLVAFAALLTLPLQAEAQKTTFVSNTGQSTDPDVREVGPHGHLWQLQAQQFRTGDNEGGYTLSAIQVRVDDFGSNSRPKVSIYTTSSGNPGSSLYVLTNPATLNDDAINTFRAPANATLEKDTNYFVVFEELGSGSNIRYDLEVTTSNSEDSGKASGWNITNSSRQRSTTATTWDNLAGKLKIAVRGTLPPAISIADASAAENAGHLLFDVTLSRSFQNTVKVDFETISGGTATEGVDYHARRTYTHVILEGDKTAQMGFALIEDTVAAAGETVKVRLSNARVVDAYGNKIKDLDITTAEATGTINAPTATTTNVPGLTIRIRDATGDEDDGWLDFRVRLSRKSDDLVCYDFETISGGTATEGTDYLKFPKATYWMQIGKRVDKPFVRIIDDSINDNGETVKVKISNAHLCDDASQTVSITRDEAIGTIRNSDPLPQAWLARFGRTVGMHVTDAVGARLRTPSGQESQVTVGGYRLPLGQQAAGGAESETTTDRLASLLTGLAGMAGLGLPQPAGGDGTDPRVARPESGPRLGQPQPLQPPRLRDVLLGSSFRLNLGDDAGPGHMRLTAWGRVAGTRFDGRDGVLSLDGDVFTGTVGIDGTWGRWLLGLAAAHTQADGTFAGDGMSDRGQGTLDNTLTSIHPYVQYAVTDRLNLWGMVGYGWGDTEVTIGHTEILESDTNFLMGAVGGRGVLLAAAETGGFELATRSDAMLTQTSLDDTAGMAGAEGAAHRLRVVLEGSRGFTWPEGRTLTPTLEVGLRHDWGDAETGFGLEVGGRVQYADPRLGLTIEGAVRGLLAHEDSDYQEWGASGSLRIAPGAGGQGLSLTLSPTWGAASSGIDGLWSRQTTAGLAPQGNRAAPTGRLNAEIGYGVAAPFSTGLLTPYAGTVLTDGAARTYRLGTRWTSISGLTLNLEGQRQEPAGQQPVNQGLQLQVGWGF